MKLNNLLNKPIVLSLIISLVFIGSSFVIRGAYQFLLIPIVLFGFPLYMGVSHVRTFKEAMPKANKIKISLYYFLFWFLSISSIVIFMVINTTLKDAPLFSINPKSIRILLTIFLFNFLVFGLNSLIIYFALGLGCKWMLKQCQQFENKDSIPKH